MKIRVSQFFITLQILLFCFSLNLFAMNESNSSDATRVKTEEEEIIEQFELAVQFPDQNGRVQLAVRKTGKDHAPLVKELWRRHNLRKRFVFEPQRVTQVFRSTADHLLEISYGDQSIRATDRHPFFVINKNGYVEAKDLEIGDFLLSVEHKVIPIHRIETVHGEFPVCNIEVENNNNYFAGGVLVHNCNMRNDLKMPAVALGVAAAEMGIAEATAAATALGGPAVGAAVFVGSAAATGYALHEATKPADTGETSSSVGKSESLENSGDIRPASSANAKEALEDKLSGLEKAQKEAQKSETLPDGRVRYYSAERPAQTSGPTRGASFVTEHNPATGKTRQWVESYDHGGTVNRVHPKTIDGQVVKGKHFPPTGKELKK